MHLPEPGRFGAHRWVPAAVAAGLLVPSHALRRLADALLAALVLSVAVSVDVTQLEHGGLRVLIRVRGASTSGTGDSREERTGQ